LTTPLITTASGAKMGKTAAGAVWLTEDRLSPFEYWQFWRNTEDADVGRFLRLFTDLPLAQIASLEGGDVNVAKRKLAIEATRLAHGDEAAMRATLAADRLFWNAATAEVQLGGPGTSAAGAVGLPTVPPPEKHWLSTSPTASGVVLASGMAASNSEARRLIRSGGVRINDELVTDELRRYGPEDLRNGVLKVSVGHKRHRLIRPD